MKTKAFTGVVSMVFAAIVGCAAPDVTSDDVMEPDSRVGALCEKGNFHQTMRELPGAMAAWAEYTRRTGRTSEGAAGYLYAKTMASIADKGDAYWGKILDDPEIPYDYKTDMVFQILESRLARGAVYLGNHEHLIVPRYAPADLDKDMLKLPGSSRKAPAN